MELKYQNTIVWLISWVLISAFALNFLGEIVFGIFRLGVLDEIGSLIVLFTGFFTWLILKKVWVSNINFLISFLLLTFIYVLFYYNTFLSFIYEYYKLFIFLFFLPVLKFFSTKGLLNFLRKLHWLFLIVLTVNLVFVVLQYATSNKILDVIGYNELRVSGWERVGRYTGLFDVATLGSTSLLILMLNEMTNRASKSYKYLVLVCLLSILFSSSKASYVVFVLWVLVYYKDKIIKNALKLFAGLSTVFLVVIYYTYDAILAKIVQYQFFLENMHNPVLVNLATVEKRAMFWARSLKIFKENPFGLGFGSFGDASAKFNPDSYRMPRRLWLEKNVYMSDSALSHLLAEQGVVVLLYFFVIFFPLFTIVKGSRKYVYLLMIFYFVQILFTMGFTSGSWPLVFALIHGIIYYSKRFEKIFQHSLQ